MVRSFADQGTEDVFNGVDSKAARKVCPSELVKRARQRLEWLNAAMNVNALRLPPGNQLEQLSGDRKGQWSIRINQQYRICFRWDEPDAYDVEITDYH